MRSCCSPPQPAPGFDQAKLVVAQPVRPGRRCGDSNTISPFCLSALRGRNGQKPMIAKMKQKEATYDPNPRVDGLAKTNR